jgi:hypothetical protein
MPARPKYLRIRMEENIRASLLQDLTDLVQQEYGKTMRFYTDSVFMHASTSQNFNKSLQVLAKKVCGCRRNKSTKRNYMHQSDCVFHSNLVFRYRSDAEKSESNIDTVNYARLNSRSNDNI